MPTENALAPVLPTDLFEERNRQSEEMLVYRHATSHEVPVVSLRVQWLSRSNLPYKNAYDELAQQAPQKASFSTNVYDRQLAEADAMIAQLIHDNSAALSKTAQR